MKMTENTNELFKYLDLLIKAENAGHKVNREVTEVIGAIREGLNLKSKGAIGIARPDGNKVILNENGLYVKGGRVTHCDFPDKAKIYDNYFLIDSKEQVNLDFYSFKHDARFIKLDINFKPFSECGDFELVATDGSDIYGSMTTKVFKESNYSLIADLGKPNGKLKTCYVKAKSLDEGSDTLIRILKASKEG